METKIELSTDFIEMVASGALSAPYWIDEVRMIGEERGQYYSEHLANGGTIEVHDLGGKNGTPSRVSSLSRPSASICKRCTSIAAFSAAILTMLPLK